MPPKSNEVVFFDVPGLNLTEGLNDVAGCAELTFKSTCFVTCGPAFALEPQS